MTGTCTPPEAPPDAPPLLEVAPPLCLDMLIVRGWGGGGWCCLWRITLGHVERLPFCCCKHFWGWRICKAMLLLRTFLQVVLVSSVAARLMASSVALPVLSCSSFSLSLPCCSTLKPTAAAAACTSTAKPQPHDGLQSNGFRLVNSSQLLLHSPNGHFGLVRLSESSCDDSYEARGCSSCHEVGIKWEPLPQKLKMFRIEKY